MRLDQLLSQLLVWLAIMLVAACGSPPLAQPEGTIPTEAQPFPTATREKSTPKTAAGPLTQTATITTARPTFTATVKPTPLKTPPSTNLGLQIVETKPLTFDHTTPAGQTLTQLLDTPPDWPYQGAGPFTVLGWTEEGNLVVQPIIPQTEEAERPVWTIDPETGQTQTGPEGTFEPDLTRAERQLVDNFLSQQPADLKEVRAYPAPGGKYLALLALHQDKSRNRLHVYRVGQEPALASLPQTLPATTTVRYPTSFPPVWSPGGDKLAYGVAIYKADGYPPEAYELHITDVATGQVTMITPVYYKGYPQAITWSPDGQYIAFSSQREDHESLGLFVVRNDGSGLTDLIPDAQFWDLGVLSWSSTGDYIAYGAYGTGEVWLAKMSANK